MYAPAKKNAARWRRFCSAPLSARRSSPANCSPSRYAHSSPRYGICFGWSRLRYLGSWFFQVSFLRPTAIFWSAVLTVPLAALFAALSLALGVFARSTKEGQYYMLPMFFVVIPLVMISMMPNMELTLKTSLIPVTGTCMLLSRLLGPAPDAANLPLSNSCRDIDDRLRRRGVHLGRVPIPPRRNPLPRGRIEGMKLVSAGLKLGCR